VQRIGKLQKKMLGKNQAHAKTKSVNPATKMSDLLNGHLQKRRVRCGKPNCKCAKGEPHMAFYHVWHTDGRRYQKYVRRSQIDEVRRACRVYRELQIKLRFGRVEHKQILTRARELLRRLS
jgi:hypothetical protein